MKTALITGATEGIGRAIAFALARAGHQVGVCARNETRVAATVADLRAEGWTAAGAAADVGDESQVHAAVETLTGQLGPFDTLVNNAGIAILKPFDQLSVEDWDRTIGTNLRGMMLVTREILPGMRQRKAGDIVNVASLAGRNGFVGGTAYTASKHAVLGFSKSLMLEVRKDNVRVIAICPGSVDTAMLRNQDMIAREPSRILRAEDVADTVLAALRLPAGAMVSELDIRPTNP
ncbi:MAG TPA: SDR family NAD(P)-dependent oxidoreductase [Gemmatimonadales bacterium]|nr:SDR family NAD(P)-dependent oxidoreductase [Gemmatimonadales bacterium]